MNTKKIASLFASLKVGGGVEKVQANLSIGLSDLGCDFYHILCEDIGPKNDYKGKIISLKSRFILGFGFKKIISLFINAYSVAKICKKEKIDILIGQGDYFFMVSGLVKIFGFKGKNIAIVHTTIGIWGKYLNLFLRFFLSLHDKIVLISKEEYNTFSNEYNFKKEKLELIYNSIDISKIDVLKNEEVDDVGFEKFTFINIGRLTYQKGQDRLLKSFDLFNKKYPDSQLIILGDGELKEEYLNLKNTLKSGKNIYLLGNKENVYKYLSKSNCFVLSSNFEGFPMVLIEAICLGLTIISTDCETGPKELLELESDFKSVENIKKTQYGYLVGGRKDAVKNLYIAMEKYYLEQDIKYDVSSIKKIFSLDENIKNWDKLLKNI